MNLQELIELRKELKVELLELAAYSGLLEQYLEQIESGKVMPLESDLKRIEQALRLIAESPGRINDVDS